MDINCPVEIGKGAIVRGEAIRYVMFIVDAIFRGEGNCPSQWAQERPLDVPLRSLLDVETSPDTSAGRCGDVPNETTYGDESP